MFVERHNKETGQWKNLSLYKKNQDGTYTPVDIYDGRDYELFGLLAGVRGDFSGLFSIDGGAGYLHHPRGLPDDLSPEVKEEYGDGEYWHTPTWYDYSELRAYEYMMVDSCKELEKKNKKIAELEKTIKRMTQFIPKNEEAEDSDEEDCPDNEHYYPLWERFEEFVNDIAGVLDAYQIWHYNPGDVRVIMWFDS